MIAVEEERRTMPQRRFETHASSSANARATADRTSAAAAVYKQSNRK
jgi:hypothetical protein